MPFLGTTGGGSVKQYGGQANLGYFINNSVRFRSSASPYLNRTFSTPTDNKKWSWSGWVKRGDLGTWRGVFAGGNTGGALTKVEFYTDDTLYLSTWNGSSNVSILQTSQVFRDPAAWYHLLFVYDISNATANNRQRMYVNGQEVTSFASRTNFSTTDTSYWNNASYSQEIGKSYQTGTTTSKYFDGYMTEVNFIDGQALTPSSFGKTDAVTGQWVPKKFTGAYGTNGFYLKFADTSAATAAAIGKDSSTNGNNWTPNNISVTAGVTYDAMIDSPTLSAVASNYATLNPLAIASAFTLSDGNLNLSGTSSINGVSYVKSTLGVSSGKWYWEMIPSNIGGGTNFATGIVIATSSVVSTGTINLVTDGYVYHADGNKYSGGTSTAYGATYTNNDIIGVALDLDAGTLVFYKNNASQGTAYTSLSGTFMPLVALHTGGTSRTIASSFNAGQRPFVYTPPSGFKSLNTYNLP
jgi:hypothetical protein